MMMIYFFPFPLVLTQVLIKDILFGQLLLVALSLGLVYMQEISLKFSDTFLAKLYRMLNCKSTYCKFLGPTLWSSYEALGFALSVLCEDGWCVLQFGSSAFIHLNQIQKDDPHLEICFPDGFLLLLELLFKDLKSFTLPTAQESVLILLLDRLVGYCICWVPHSLDWDFWWFCIPFP